MIIEESELVKRFNSFDDTTYLADLLYEMAHDPERIIPESADKYTIMESRDNLIGLYDLCRSFVIHQMSRDHKEKY